MAPRPRFRHVRFNKPAAFADDQLRDAVRREAPLLYDDLAPPAVIVWSGFEGDRRPLWEIPDIMAACRAIIRTGYIAVLYTNLPPRRTLEGWGAIDVYLCANQNLASLDPIGSEREDVGFGPCMETAHAVADEILGRSRRET